MNLRVFLRDLSLKGVRLWREGDRIRYKASKNILTNDILATIKQHKYEILELLNANTDIPDEYPLSEGQMALWFLAQSAPESFAYNIGFAVRICSTVDVSALLETFQILTDRHCSLRTTFIIDDKKRVQKVNKSAKVCFEQRNLSGSNDEELNRQVVSAYRRPFDLKKGPLFRVDLFSRSESDYVLLITVHHICFDAWSLYILMEEFRLLYPQVRDNGLKTMPPLQSHYIDYVQWQQSVTSGSKGEKLLSYWQNQLCGVLPVLNITGDKPRPSVKAYNGSSYKFKLPNELVAKLKGFSRGEGVTIFMTLLASYQILLSRYSGQDDILVGSSVTGRDKTEFNNIVGYLINQIVIRGDLSEDPTVRDFVARVRQSVLGAIEHQDYPFPLLVQKLEPERSLGYTPVFQSYFGLQKTVQSEEFLGLLVADGKSVNWGGLELRSFGLAEQEGQFDLSLIMVDVNESLYGILKYDVDLFNHDTIERMAGHFQMILKGIVTNPDQRVSMLTLLDFEEQSRLLIEMNRTDVDYPRKKCIHHLFEEQAARTPNAIAVEHEGESVTYMELNTQANQLAHYLKKSGIVPDMLVGIFAKRSIKMVVGLLGVLKAGGAYLPLDPTYPKERLEFMINDSNVSVLIKQKNIDSALLNRDITSELVCLDDDWNKIGEQSIENPVNSVTSRNLAYVIYTSGSTGLPKGTMIVHKGVVNYLTWCIKAYPVTEGVGSPVHSSIGFDATVTSLFTPLLTGKKVVLISEENEIETLSEMLCVKSESYSLIKITPAHLDMLNGLLKRKEVNGDVKALIIGGEALFEKSLSFWRENFPDTKIINEYGPTEAVVGCCVYEAPILGQLSDVTPIGRPIANTSLYILDSCLQPVPIGVPGELYIGGDGVARGYLHRPELTKEKFLPNPFNKAANARLYKTGDLARYLSDGNIEFLGRKDYQVKVRGYRIEPGEVESVLSGFPDVAETVVIVREDRPGDKRLTAYIVPHKGREVDPVEMKNYLQNKLPEYMVPVAFMVLDALPLTPNGKIDRKALPEPTNNPFAEEYIAARTSTETIMSTIWADLLGVERVGIHDNFFKLGGHSLLSTQAVIKMIEQCEVELPMIAIFERPTVAALAGYVDMLNAESQKDEILQEVTTCEREEFEF